MKKLFKSRKFLISTLIIILLIILLIFIMFFSHNNSRNLKGAVSEAPANTNFSDVNFYNCIMDSYNEENNTNYPYDYNLSDSELASIKNVVCNTGDSSSAAILLKKGNYKYLTGIDDVFYNTKHFYENSFNQTTQYDISDLSGIEKLTNIENLVLLGNNKFKQFYTIDLKSNVNLKTLKLSVGTFQFENATSLENLEIYEWYPSRDSYKYVNNRINGIASMTNLKKLVLHNAAITDRDSFGNLQKLEEITLDKTDFYNVNLLKDISSIKKLSINQYRKLADSSYKNIQFYLGTHSYLSNLEYLSTDYIKLNNDIPKMTNLKSFEGYIRDGVNSLLFNVDQVMPNLEKLSIISYGTNAKLSEYVPGIEKLDKLSYLKIHKEANLELDNLDKLNALKKLELNNYTFKVSSVSNTIEYLSGVVNDYSKFPKLKVYDHKTTNFDSSYNLNISDSVEQIYNFTLECNDFFNGKENFNNLKAIYGGLTNSILKSSSLYKLPQLEKLDIYLIDIDNDYDTLCEGIECFNVDFKNNLKLKYLSFETYEPILNIDKLSLLENLKLKYYDEDKDTYVTIPFGEYEYLKNLYLYISGDTIKQSINFEKMPNLETLYVKSNYDDYNPTKLFNIDKLTKIKAIELNYVLSDSLDFSNSKDLAYLDLMRININGLNLKNNQKLEYFRLTFPRFNNEYSSTPLYIRKGKTINGIPGVLLPEYIKVKYIEYDNILEQKNDSLIAQEEGESEIKYIIINEKSGKYRDVLWDWNGPAAYESFYVNVFDVNLYSKKFPINIEDSYIYVKNVTKEKEIIKNIYFLPIENMTIMHSAIHKNNFKLFSFISEIEELKLIKVTSNKYTIINNDIIYYGDFDLNKVRVTNADKEVIGDKLIIKFNDKIVDTYNLVKLNSLIGDTNNDGEVTISDMILQYKHAQYELDLEADAFYRADVNSDKDVDTKDVDSLYDTIKINN